MTRACPGCGVEPPFCSVVIKPRQGLGLFPFFFGLETASPISEPWCLVGGVGAWRVLFVEPALMHALATGMSVCCSGVPHVLCPESHQCSSTDFWVAHLTVVHCWGQRCPQHQRPPLRSPHCTNSSHLFQRPTGHATRSRRSVSAFPAPGPRVVGRRAHRKQAAPALAPAACRAPLLAC